MAIGWGVHSIQSRRPVDDFDGALAQIENMLEIGEFDQAAHRLTDGIEPNLERASPEQQARFHAALADWASMAPTPTGKPDEKRYQDADTQYSKAIELGLKLSPERLHRWAAAQLALGRVEQAQERLGELASLFGGALGESARLHRSSLFRDIVNYTVSHGGSGTDSLMRTLGEFRAEPGLPVGDEAWAMARQAELRIESGNPEDAINHLLIDMRRLEPRLQPGLGINLGELYALLGRAYYESGDESAAERQLQHSLTLFDGPEMARGEALSLLGQIRLTHGELDEARQTFDTVLADFASTPIQLSGLLGRAESLGASGEHVKAMADYAELIDRLDLEGPSGSVTADRVSQSLVDRHDAVLALGNLDVALQYVLLAEKLFVGGDLPPAVLFRIASTSRLIADGIIREATGGRDIRTLDPKEIDPGIREQANRHYKRAADYYVRHARASAARVEDGSEWADSLWMAADSYDLAGWHDQATDFFKQYIGGRPADDGRRAEAMFRLAQSYNAQLDYGAAANVYQDIVRDHPQSPFAAQSHVPLAQCLAAIGKPDQAEQLLESVLQGNQNLTPDAPEFHRAVVQYADLLFARAEYARAIENYDSAMKWKPESTVGADLPFKLGESYRGLAGQIAEEMRTPSLTPSERDDLEQRRHAALESAVENFSVVVSTLEAIDQRKLDTAHEGQLRMAVMYRADAAYEMGEYEKAIQLYEQAERQYSSNPVSVLALVQIVNSHSALGQVEKARTAHRRAQIRLSQLPDEAFLGPDAMFDRATWERWLAASPVEVSLAPDDSKEVHR